MVTAGADIKYAARTDLLFVVFDRAADFAGLFTRSRCPSAPVDHCRAILAQGRVRGVVVIRAMQMPLQAARAGTVARLPRKRQPGRLATR